MTYPTYSPQARRVDLSLGFFYTFMFLASIWAVSFTNWFLFGGSLSQFGIRPHDTAGLVGIVFSPFLHVDIHHLISNSIPGAVFCFLVASTGQRPFWEVTFISVLVGGLGTWAVGGAGTVHIGASGLLYGWLAYLVLRGFFNRSGGQIITGLTLAFFYSGLIYGVLPTNGQMSWEGHLFGAIGGATAAALIKSDDKPKAVSSRRNYEIENRQRYR